MYLSTPEEGGETVFPEAELQSPREGLSACVQKGLANKPQKGDMLLFYSLNPDGSVDERSLHESCPTLKGVRGALSGGGGRAGRRYGIASHRLTCRCHVPVPVTLSFP